jgi:hypothetical protein
MLLKKLPDWQLGGCTCTPCTPPGYAYAWRPTWQTCRLQTANLRITQNNRAFTESVFVHITPVLLIDIDVSMVLLGSYTALLLAHEQFGRRSKLKVG